MWASIVAAIASLFASTSKGGTGERETLINESHLRLTDESLSASSTTLSTITLMVIVIGVFVFLFYSKKR